MCRLCGSVAPKGSTAASQRSARMSSCVCSARIQRRGAVMRSPRELGKATLALQCCMMRFLLTNDDGIDAEGFAALADAARHFGDHSVVAPDCNWSVCGHVVTTE